MEFVSASRLAAVDMACEHTVAFICRVFKVCIFAPEASLPAAGIINPQGEVFHMCWERFGKQHRHIALIDADEVSSCDCVRVWWISTLLAGRGSRVASMPKDHVISRKFTVRGARCRLMLT